MNFVVEFVSEYNDDIRPIKLLNFADILAISAKEDKSDIKKVKLRLRALLDVLAELEGESEESDLYKTTKEALKEKGPVLV